MKFNLMYGGDNMRECFLVGGRDCNPNCVAFMTSETEEIGPCFALNRIASIDVTLGEILTNLK